MVKHKRKRKTQRNHEGLRKADIPSHKVLPHQKLYMFMAVVVLLLFSFVSLSYLRVGFGEQALFGLAADTGGLSPSMNRELNSHFSIQGKGTPRDGARLSPGNDPDSVYVWQNGEWYLESYKGIPNMASTAPPEQRGALPPAAAPAPEPAKKKAKKKKKAKPKPAAIGDPRTVDDVGELQRIGRELYAQASQTKDPAKKEQLLADALYASKKAHKRGGPSYNPYIEEELKKVRAARAPPAADSNQESLTGSFRRMGFGDPKEGDEINDHMFRDGKWVPKSAAPVDSEDAPPARRAPLESRDAEDKPPGPRPPLEEHDPQDAPPEERRVEVSFGTDAHGQEINYNVNAQGHIFIDNKRIDPERERLLKERIPQFRAAQRQARQPEAEPTPAPDIDAPEWEGRADEGIGGFAVPAPRIGDEGDESVGIDAPHVRAERAPPPEEHMGPPPAPAAEAKLVEAHTKRHEGSSTKDLTDKLGTAGLSDSEKKAIETILVDRGEPLRGAAARPDVPEPRIGAGDDESVGLGDADPLAARRASRDARRTAFDAAGPGLEERAPGTPPGGPAAEAPPRRVVAVAVGPAGMGSARTACTKQNPGATCKAKVFGGKVHYVPEDVDMGEEIAKLEPLPTGEYPDVPAPRVDADGDASADIGDVRGDAALREESRAAAGIPEREPGVPPEAAAKAAAASKADPRVATAVDKKNAETAFTRFAEERERCKGYSAPGACISDRYAKMKTEICQGSIGCEQLYAKSVREDSPGGHDLPQDVALAVGAIEPPREEGERLAAGDLEPRPVASPGAGARASRTPAPPVAPDAPPFVPPSDFKVDAAKKSAASADNPLVAVEGLQAGDSIRTKSGNEFTVKEQGGKLVWEQTHMAKRTDTGVSDGDLKHLNNPRNFQGSNSRFVFMDEDRRADQGPVITNSEVPEGAVVTSRHSGSQFKAVKGADGQLHWVQIKGKDSDPGDLAMSDREAQILNDPDYYDDGTTEKRLAMELPPEPDEALAEGVPDEPVDPDADYTFEDEDGDGHADDAEDEAVAKADKKPAGGSAGDAAEAKKAIESAFSPRKPGKSATGKDFLEKVKACKKGKKCTIKDVGEFEKISDTKFKTSSGTVISVGKQGDMTETDSDGNILYFTDKAGNKHDFQGMGVTSVDQAKDGSVSGITFNKPENCQGLLFLSVCSGGETTAKRQPDGSYKMDSGAVLIPDQSGMVVVQNEDGSTSLMTPGPGGLNEVATIPSDMGVTKSGKGATTVFEVKDAAGNLQTISMAARGNKGGPVITTTDPDGNVVNENYNDPTTGQRVHATFDHEDGTMEKTCANGQRCGFATGCNENGDCESKVNLCEASSPQGQCNPCRAEGLGRTCAIKDPATGETIDPEELCKDSTRVSKEKCIDQLKSGARAQMSFQSLMSTISEAKQMAAEAKEFCGLVADKRDCDSIFGDWFGVNEWVKDLRRTDPTLAALFDGNWEESICWKHLDRSNAEPGEEGFFYDVDGSLKFWIAAEKAPYSVPTERDSLHEQEAWYYRVTGEVSPSQLCKIDTPLPDDPSKSDIEKTFKNEFLTFSFHLVGPNGNTVIDTDKNPETPNHFKIRCDEGGVSLISSQTLVRILAKEFTQVCVKFHNPSNLHSFIRDELKGSMWCNTIVPSNPEISQVPPPEGGDAAERPEGETETGSFAPQIVN